MSTEPRKLAAVPEPVSHTTPSAVGHGLAGARAGRSPRGAALGMTAVLGLAVAGPALARDLSSQLWPVLVLPALLATLAARLVFESIDGALAGPGGNLHVPGAAGGATVGAVMAASALITRSRPTVTVALSAALIAAGADQHRVHPGPRDPDAPGPAPRVLAGTSRAFASFSRELVRSPEASLVGSAAARRAAHRRGPATPSAPRAQPSRARQAGRESPTARRAAATLDRRGCTSATCSLLRV